MSSTIMEIKREFKKDTKMKTMKIGIQNELNDNQFKLTNLGLKSGTVKNIFVTVFKEGVDYLVDGTHRFASNLMIDANIEIYRIEYANLKKKKFAFDINTNNLMCVYNPYLHDLKELISTEKIADKNYEILLDSSVLKNAKEYMDDLIIFNHKVIEVPIKNIVVYKQDFIDFAVDDSTRLNRVQEIWNMFT